MPRVVLVAVAVAVGAMLVLPVQQTAAATSGVTTPAPDINAQSFESAPATYDGLLVRSARPQGDGSWQLGATLHYARRALSFANRTGDVDLVQTVLGDLWMLDLGAATGYGKWTFEATLPVALLMRGGGPNLLSIDRPLSPAFGDLRLGARRHLWQRSLGDLGEVDVAAMALYAAPTGASGSWLTNGGARVDLLGLGTWRYAGWQVDAAFGLRLRPLERLDAPVADPATGQVKVNDDGSPVIETALAVGSEVVLQIGGGRRWLAQRLGGRLALQIKGAAASDATAGQTLAEVLAQADWRLARGAWRVFGAVGGAMTSGYGAAQVRLMAGLRFDPGLLANDADGDGLDDRDDRCPKEAEDKDGFQDSDGCPDPDNDGDGVPDSVDRCPLVPEDRDGRHDGDGCPDLDDDGDGIPDAQDKCPTEAEDFDGYDDTDGCPDRDNDGDGIPDEDDLCPNAAEDKIGPDRQDGCPDGPAPAPVSDEGTRLRLQGRVGFAYATATLSAAGLNSLTAAATYLRAHREIQAIEVAVFTDNNGVPAALKAQSQARAEAVKAYLVKKSGLASHQIRAVGRGAAEPIADNRTLAGRSRNRRVELRILKRLAPPPGRAAAPTASPRRPTAPSPAANPRRGPATRASTQPAAARRTPAGSGARRGHSGQAGPPPARRTPSSPSAAAPDDALGPAPGTPAAGNPSQDAPSSGPSPARPTP